MTATMATPGRAAAPAQLRELAEALETLAARGITEFSLFVSVRPRAAVYEQAERVSMVDALAAQLGLVAAPAQAPYGAWSHETRVGTDGVRVVVTTFIDFPPRRCVCGAVCAHEPVT